ncbi:MMPL family transporter [uncultured Amnibacterium sp.]|uniref:MMPL family transporter n=1 Tax=uncultured Amnibacterium sp. TaxID=1631851 RepID=UPI0035CC0848
MTALLHRLGRAALTARRRILAAWALIFIAFVVGGFGFGGALANSFTIPGTESQTALDRLAAVFPQAAGGSAQVLLIAPSGSRIDDAAPKSAIARTVKAVSAISGVQNASSPFSAYATRAVSPDHRAAIVSVQFTKIDEQVPGATVRALTSTGSIARDAGLRVSYSGQVFQTDSVAVSPTEGLGVLFAAVVLVITFGALVLAGLPLISAIIGVALSLAALRIIALFATVSTSAPTLALMLGLAVGIDYGLFIVSRHREQLARGMTVEESLPAAVATAGTAVVFAGTTVIIALLGLLVVGIPFLSIMGIGAAFAVLVGVASSITLLPALLAIGGTRFVPKPGSRVARRALAMQDGGRGRTLGARWVAIVQKMPVVAVLAVVGVLGLLAVPALSLRLSLPNNGSQPVGTPARSAYDLTTKYFGEGRNGPLLLLVDITQDDDFGTHLDRVRDRIAALPDVVAVGRATPNASLDTAIVQVVPGSGPDSPRTEQLVQRIRALEPAFQREYHLPVAVSGATAVGIDISDRLGQAFLPFILVVVGLSVVLLMMVFRSLVVPLKAAIGFLLSVGASLGVTVAVVQLGAGAGLLHTEPGPLLSFLPILVIAILFGLSMDYEVFLVSGMRESWVHGGNAHDAVRKGFTGGARVVTAAALIMLFVFASFVPEGGSTITPIAFALASGILFDAFLVRMTLVPAVMTLVGRAGWYLPKWLDHILPSVDIEGAGLVRQRADEQWAAGESAWALSCSNLLPAVGYTGRPLTLHASAGRVTGLAVPAAARRGVVATLTGLIAPAGGHVQAAGYASPGAATQVRRVAAAVFDDGSAGGESIGALIAERLRYAPRARRVGSVESWLSRLPVGRAGLRTRFDSLVATDRLLALAAVALAGGASIVVVDVGDIGAEAEERLAAAMTALLDPGTAAVLVTVPRTADSRTLPAARTAPLQKVIA